ncbi:MAG: PQQ-binding-like beta-propeller repeat protein, partial [Anaerolineales bacterium]
RMATYGVLVVAFLWFGGVKFLWPKIETVMEGLPGSGPSAAFADAIASQTPVGTPALEATLTPTPVQVITNLEPEIIWEQQVADGFATGVTYDPAREVFYGVSTDNRLLAYSLEGELQWEAELPAKPFEHNPLLTSEGTILIADAAAGISAFSPEGQLIWHFISSRAPVTTSGPVLSDSSTIYYVVSDYAKGYIQAVSTEGEDLWSLQTETSNFYYPLSLSQDGRYLFLREEVFDTAEQSSVNIDTELIVTRYIGGQDGNIYMLSGQNLLQIDITQQPIEVLNSFEWDHQSSGVIFSAQQAPIQAVVSPDRTARFFYTSPGGSTSVVWLEIEPGLVGKVTAKFSGGSIVAEKDFDNLLVCGGLPFQEQALTCGLLSMEAEDPLWTIDLDQNGPALGGFWIEDTVYFSTANGMLYAISANGSNTTSSNPTAPQTGETVGIVWSKPLNEEIDFGPRQAADGSVTMFLDPPELLILNDDGSERIRTTLYKPWYETKGGRGESIVFYPQWLDDQFIVSVSQDPSVYAQDTDGNLLWEFPLENPPDDYPYLIDGKTLYVVDKKGLLYKFDASGLIWTFTPEVAELPASGLAVDPDGNIYYSLTNLAKGFLQAVSPDGEPLWNSEIHTSSFYDPILFSVDGNYLFIKDEIYRAEDGQFLDVDYGIPVAEFIVGEDGLNYLRSEQSIIQWELSPTGFEILHTAASPSIYPYSYRGRIEVDQNSIIWVYTFSAGGYDISYLSLDGMSIGEYHQQPADLIYKLDKKNLLIDLCQFSSEALSCGDFDPRTNSYSLETNISGIPDFLGTGWYASGEDFVFIHTRDDELFKVKLK